MPDIKSEIEKRRTFAIISHPDAGKTTLTEKFLLYGGAINLAGSVKGKKTAKHAVSDWMEIEKERGISVTSSVLQFNYGGYCINILDTPGHEDFSEDTYRTLMAADSAVMVIDASKGVEKQTIKLFKVCVMRHIPIFTFINKMDREANDPFELLDEIESVLGISTCPVNWPIGCGKEFKGVYDRNEREVSLFKAAMNGQKEVDTKNISIDDAALKDEIGQAFFDKLKCVVLCRYAIYIMATTSISRRNLGMARENTSALRWLFFFCRCPADCSSILYLYAIWKVCRFHKDLKK